MDTEKEIPRSLTYIGIVIAGLNMLAVWVLILVSAKHANTPSYSNLSIEELVSIKFMGIDFEAPRAIVDALISNLSWESLASSAGKLLPQATVEWT